jgi:hypothetical protein
MPANLDIFVSHLLVVCAVSLRMTGVTAAVAMAPLAVAASDELAAPPIGFLDYLGSMVEQDGELVDPLSLQAPMTVEQTAKAQAPLEEPAPSTADSAEEER